MLYLEVGDVRPARDQPPPPARDVAGPSLNMDLFKAEVAVHSGTQPHPSPPLTGPATGTGTSLALLKV